MSRSLVTVVVLAMLAVPASAQTPLSLADAIARAQLHSASARVAAAALAEADARIEQARSAFLPRVDLVESWQRGNQPLFAFSSLLAQRRLTADAFGLDTLKSPPAIDNVRTAVTIEQPLLDASSRISLLSSRIVRRAADNERTLVNQRLAVDVTEVYAQVIAASGARRTAAAASEAGAASRVLAVNRRDAGLATDADVLQVDVHLARVRQRAIQSEADDHIARARLNALIGEPLDARFSVGPVAPAPLANTPDESVLERSAAENRPEVRRAALNEALARAAHDAVRAAFWPDVVAQVGWDANGSTVTSQRGSWVVGAVARVNLLRGLGDRARLAETRHTIARRAIEREDAETQARLDFRIARARLDAADASLAAGRAAAAAARESQRIVRDRYEAGLSDIVSLLRASEAVIEAEEAQTTAEVRLLVAVADLNRTLGR